MGFLPTQSMSLCRANLHLKSPRGGWSERLRQKEKKRSRSIIIAVASDHQIIITQGGGEESKCSFLICVLS